MIDAMNPTFVFAPLSSSQRASLVQSAATSDHTRWLPRSAHLQRRQERLLRDLDLADLPHALLALLLLLEELALAGDVAAVALGE